MADYSKRFTTDSTENKGNLSSTLPRPNIVRIEILDGSARERYLKTYGETHENVYSFANTLRKKALYNMFSGREEERVFYGFLSPEANSSFNMGATWENSQFGGNVFGVIKQVTDNAGSVGSIVNGALTVGKSIQDIGNLMGGMNSTATGAATMSEFKNVTLDGFTVKCVWYLPEQEDIATYSLKILYRMLYPKQLTQATAADIAGNIAKEGVHQILDKKDTAEKSTEKTQTLPPNGDNNPGVISGIAGGLAASAYSVTNTLGNAFGSNTTLNPLPVRVCIGHHLDIEPLVINKIETTFSRETFISEKEGRHLPLFATTTISFRYWMNPAPNLEFASILGTELFGDKAIGDTSTGVKK